MVVASMLLSSIANLTSSVQISQSSAPPSQYIISMDHSTVPESSTSIMTSLTSDSASTLSILASAASDASATDAPSSSSAWESLIACDISSDAWLATATYHTEETTTYTQTGCTACVSKWTGPANATAYTTLCDGIPRAHGTPTWTLVDEPYNTTIETIPVLATSSDGQPTCTIDNSGCAQLISYYADSYATAITSFYSLLSAGTTIHKPGSHSPRCHTDYTPFTPATTAAPSTATSIACNPKTVTDFGIVDPCYIEGGPIQLAYWPVSVKGDTCGNRSTILESFSTLRTASTFGTTVVSPTVLVSFATLWARDGCGERIGTPLKDFVLPQLPGQISSQCQTYHAGFGLGTSFNFADFNSPVPATAYNCQPVCNGGGSDFGQVNFCTTIWDDFNPFLASPTDVWSLQPEWNTCKIYYDQNQISDPPVALTPVSAQAVVTKSTSITTPAAAIPVLTSIPTQTSDAARPADPTQQPGQGAGKGDTSISSSSTTLQHSGTTASTELQNPFEPSASDAADPEELGTSSQTSRPVASTARIETTQTSLKGATGAAGPILGGLGVSPSPATIPSVVVVSAAFTTITMHPQSDGGVVIGTQSIAPEHTTSPLVQTVAAVISIVTGDGLTMTVVVPGHDTTIADPPASTKSTQLAQATTTVTPHATVVLTAQATGQGVIVNGHTMSVGQTSVISDYTVVAGTSAIAIGSSTLLLYSGAATITAVQVYSNSATSSSSAPSSQQSTQATPLLSLPPVLNASSGSTTTSSVRSGTTAAPAPPANIPSGSSSTVRVHLLHILVLCLSAASLTLLDNL